MSKNEKLPNTSRRGFLRAAGAVAITASPVGRWLSAPCAPVTAAATPSVVAAATQFTVDQSTHDALHYFTDIMYHIRDEHAETLHFNALMRKGLPPTEIDNIVEFWIRGGCNQRGNLAFLEPHLEQMIDARPSLDAIRAYLASSDYKELLDHNRFWQIGHSPEDEAQWLYQMAQTPKSEIASEAAQALRITETDFAQFTSLIRRYPAIIREIEDLDKGEEFYNNRMPTFGTCHREHASPIPHDYYEGQNKDSWHDKLLEQAEAANAVKTKTR